MGFRPYQRDALDAAWNYLKKEKGNPIIALPTGTGKSWVLAGLLRRISKYPRGRVLILTHVKELIQQNYNVAAQLCGYRGLGVYSAGLRRRELHRRFTFAGIQSIYNRADLLGSIDLVIVDECHCVPDTDSSMYQTLFDVLRQQNAKLRIVGLSATPFRGATALTAGDTFAAICYNACTREAFLELVDLGYLCPLVAVDPNVRQKVDGVGTTKGDFVKGQLQKKLNTDKLNITIVQESIKRAVGRQHWLVFCTGVKHADDMARVLNTHGIPAASVHSKLNNDERERRITAFKQGKLRALTNNNVLTTGFDYPAIDMILMARPTLLPGLWVQMLGRGTRPSPGKATTLVLDFAGNTKRLGPINDLYMPLLNRRGKGNRQGAAPVRVCEQCRAILPAQTRTCPHCGFEFPQTKRLREIPAELDLIRRVEVAAYDVQHVRYTLHNKVGSPKSLRVTYFCGLKNFAEWVCLGHHGYARNLAINWWRRHTGTTELPVPADAVEALKHLDVLKKPSKILVKTGGKHPIIEKVLFIENNPDKELTNGTT